MNVNEIDTRIRLHQFIQGLNAAYPDTASHPELTDRLLRENADHMSHMTPRQAIDHLGELVQQAVQKRRKRDEIAQELSIYDSGSPGPGGGSIEDMIDARANASSMGDLITERRAARQSRYDILASKRAKEERQQRRA